MRRTYLGLLVAAASLAGLAGVTTANAQPFVYDWGYPGYTYEYPGVGVYAGPAFGGYYYGGPYRHHGSRYRAYRECGASADNLGYGRWTCK